MLRLSARLRALALAASVLHAPALFALEAPQPPCGAAPAPGYPALDGPPGIAVLRGAAAAAWTAPPCIGWDDGDPDLVVAMAGTFRHPGSASDLLERIGAITSLRGTRYWSVTDKAWRELISDASALADADPRSRRPDFSAGEIATGKAFYALQAERRLGEAVYRFRLRESTPGRIVIESENVSPLRAMLLPLFGPGDLRSVYFLERRAPGVWGYYALVSAASAFGRYAESSVVSRSVAVYRRFAGLPASPEPTAAR